MPTNTNSANEERINSTSSSEPRTLSLSQLNNRLCGPSGQAVESLSNPTANGSTNFAWIPRNYFSPSQGILNLTKKYIFMAWAYR